MWFDYVDEGFFLSSIYGCVPELDGVIVNNVVFDNQHNDVRVTFEMPRYCDKPPLKWQQQNFNVVAVELCCSNVGDFSLSQSDKSTKSNITISKLDETKLALEIVGGVSLNLNMELVFIANVSGYRDGLH